MERSRTGPARAPARAWRVLALAVVAQVGFSITEQGIPALTGFIKADLGVSASVAGLIVASFTLGRIFGSYVAGVAADRLGERRVLLAGALATGTLTALAASTPVVALAALLMAAGVASASATPAGGRLVLLAFPRHRHGLALGMRQTGIPIGGLVAAAVLPWLAHAAGWRWALAAAGALTVVCILPLAVAPHDAPPAPAAPLRNGRPPSPGRNRNVRLLTIWACLIVVGQYAILAFLALDVHDATGVSLARASLLVVVAQVCGIAGRLAWGAASDRFAGTGRKPTLLVLTSFGVAAAALLYGVPRSVPLAALAVVAGIAGLALIGFQGLWITMLAEAVPVDRVGATTGFAITFVTMAVTATPPLFGLVADLAGTYRAIWGVLTLLLALAFIPALLVREHVE